MPLGFLLPLVSRRFLTFKRVLLFALFLSLSVESIQFVLRFFGNPRAVDIDDVILNTLGAGVGFAFYKSFIPSYVARRAVESVETDSNPLEDELADTVDSERL